MELDLYGKAGVETTFVLRHQTCQEKIDANINSRKDEWLQLTHILQNIQGKGIATVLEKHKAVVLKVQLAEKAKQEYEIQNKLKDLPGFIRFDCIFTCKGDAEYIKNYGMSGTPKQRLCSAKGSTMGIIMMPYYPLESFDKFMRKGMGTGRRRLDILARVIENVYHAYKKKGFTHGDLFAKNILLQDNLQPVIIDFELSQFNHNKSQFYRDIYDLFSGALHAMPKHSASLNEICRQHVVMHMAYNREPTDENISKLLDAVRSIV